MLPKLCKGIPREKRVAIRAAQRLVERDRKVRGHAGVILLDLHEDADRLVGERRIGVVLL